jgi:digeranylgeranylglycerophospholipid reductase
MDSLGSLFTYDLKNRCRGNMNDVLIVGAGPAGCFTGKLLAELGLDVVIIEEHAEIGHPVSCAGILGVGGLEELGIKRGKWVLGELNGATFHSPSGKQFTVTRGKVEALVVDRASFDEELASRAVNAGANLLMKTRCVGVRIGDEPSIKVDGPNGKYEIKGRLLIGADGPNSLVAREAGLFKAARYVSCAQIEVLADVNPNIVEVYFGRDIAPGFFGWMVPAGEVTRVGLGTTEGHAMGNLLNFIKEQTVRKKIFGKKFLEITAGLIPEPLTREIYSDRVMLVGDAAGHVKPLTGGGIYLGLSCAKIASNVAAKSLEVEPTAKALKSYDTEVRKKIGRELALGMQMRNLIKKLPDDKLDSILQLIAEPDVQDLVLEHADFDHHDMLIKAIIKKGPSLLRSIGLRKLLKYLAS